MKQLAAVILAINLLLSGCAGVLVNPDETSTATSTVAPTPTATATPVPTPTATPTPEPPNNPWQADPVRVKITNHAGEDRNYRPLVEDTLEFWTNRSSLYWGDQVNLVLVEDTTEYDVEVRFVPAITNCERLGYDSDTIGCAPVYDQGDIEDETTTVRVLTGYNNETTRTVLKHELGHVFGLDHDDSPLFMNETLVTATKLPEPDVVDREYSWNTYNLKVYADYSTVPEYDRQEYESQVQHALAYYESGAEGHVPPQVNFEMVNSKDDAHIVIAFPREHDEIDNSGGSIGRAWGTNTDTDESLEYFNYYEMAISGIDEDDHIAWHVGFWLGDSFTPNPDTDLPPPFEDGEDREKWW